MPPNVTELCPPGSRASLADGIVVTGCGVGSSLPRLLCLGPTQAFAGELDETVQDGEEAFDRVEPGGRGRTEVERPARMAGGPSVLEAHYAVVKPKRALSSIRPMALRGKG
jgi:hypothetical protein